MVSYSRSEIPCQRCRSSKRNVTLSNGAESSSNGTEASSNSETDLMTISNEIVPFTMPKEVMDLDKNSSETEAHDELSPFGYPNIFNDLSFIQIENPDMLPSGPHSPPIVGSTPYRAIEIPGPRRPPSLIPYIMSSVSYFSFQECKEIPHPEDYEVPHPDGHLTPEEINCNNEPCEIVEKEGMAPIGSGRPKVNNSSLPAVKPEMEMEAKKIAGNEKEDTKAPKGDVSTSPYVFTGRYIDNPFDMLDICESFRADFLRCSSFKEFNELSDEEYSSENSGELTDDEYSSESSSELSDYKYSSEDSGKLSGDEYSSEDSGELSGDEYSSKHSDELSGNEYSSEDNESEDMETPEHESKDEETPEHGNKDVKTSERSDLMHPLMVFTGYGDVPVVEVTNPDDLLLKIA